MAMANIDTLGRITPHRARIPDFIRGGTKVPAMGGLVTGDLTHVNGLH